MYQSAYDEQNPAYDLDFDPFAHGAVHGLWGIGPGTGYLPDEWPALATHATPFTCATCGMTVLKRVWHSAIVCNNGSDAYYCSASCAP